jgi:rhamnulokinase
MKYRLTFEKLKECTGRDYPVIHVIGGGTKDTLLCRLTASSCNRTVKAGPIEATVMGNIAVQLMSDKSIESISQARKIVADSSELKTYEPSDTTEWEKAYADFLRIL